MRARSADPRGDTIVACATAPGRGAVAIVRLSGPEAFALARRVGAPAALTPRRATRVRLHACDAPDEPIDDALVTAFPAPHSYTGEDVVECAVHGGAQVSALLLAALAAAGARPALAGEFTERAVRHGKLDVLQAEAIADLIDARSRAMHRAALQQLGGALSRRITALRDALLDAEALIAYAIDFPEEDDGPVPRDAVLAAVARVRTELEALRATLPAAELGREGVSVVLAGAPNAGKSSLFNALLGQRRAIVSDVPGTTRDAIEAIVEHDPWPLRLTDTAGLRASDDALERLGVEVSTERLARAHVVLVCGDDDERLAAALGTIAPLSAAARLAVRTKADLLDDPRHWTPSAAIRTHAAAAIAVSAEHGDGLDALRAAITAAVRAAHPDPAEELPLVTRARHVAALDLAGTEIRAFENVWASDALPAPVAATHLRAAVHALDELVGGVDVEDILERVFRTFCVGK